MRSDRDCREVFHFLFLEWLLRVTAPSLVVLKGGVNLRFFHGSPRYSEDMDLDVDAPKLSVGTLRKNSRGAFAPADLASLDPSTREQAIDHALSLSFADFDGQVLEFLDEDAARTHGTPEAFEAMQAAVVAQIEGTP